MTIPGRVTIAIPTFNRGLLSVRAVKSALAQTYSDVEVIVSDDASADNTAKLLGEIQNDRLTVHIQLQRLGVVENFNFLLRKATGEFCVTLGDDDVLMSDAVAKLVAPFRCKDIGSQSGRVGMTWCPCLVIDRDGVELWETDAGPQIETVPSMLAQLFAGNRGPRTSATLLRTQDAIAVGGYKAKYGDLSDTGLFGLAAMRHDIAVCIQEPLLYFTMHSGNMTARSSVKQWQSWARAVHADLLESAKSNASQEDIRRLRAARSDLVTGVTVSILIHTIGKPGWIRGLLLQSMRTPGAIFTPYVFRRLLRDGRKVLILRSKRRRATS